MSPNGQEARDSILPTERAKDGWSGPGLDVCVASEPLGCGLALALVLALASLARYHLLSVPFERDEGEYGYMAQLINQGVPPYVAAYNMKLPGTYGMYALFLRVFGNTAGGVRTGLLVVNAVSIVLVFLLARRIVGPAAALAGAMAYAALSLSPTVYGTFAHATHFVMVFALAGLLCLGSALRTGRPWTFLVSGALLGLSILMKQNGVFFAALGLCRSAGSSGRRRRVMRRGAASASDSSCWAWRYRSS